MQNLLVTMLKPNPAGKDRTRHGGATPAQLGAEWVQFKNQGDTPMSLEDIELYHVAYPVKGGAPKWAKIVGLAGKLEKNQSQRVHSGQRRDLSVLRPEDLQGADLHSFTGKDVYVWNNEEGDTAGLWRPSQEVWVDQASYDPNPPEGVVLVRSGDKLIPGRR
jgi:hypothetical protein